LINGGFTPLANSARGRKDREIESTQRDTIEN